MRVFRLCFESAAWFLFVALAVLWCDPAVTAKVPAWRVAALALAGCALARVVRRVNELAAEAWNPPGPPRWTGPPKPFDFDAPLRRAEDITDGHAPAKPAAEQDAELRDRFPAVDFIPMPRRGAERHDAAPTARAPGC